MQHRTRPSSLLLATVVLACGPGSPDPGDIATSLSEPMFTTNPDPSNGEDPTHDADPSMPTLPTEASATDVDPATTSMGSVTSVTITSASDSDIESESLSISDPSDDSGPDSDLCARMGGFSGVSDLTGLFLGEVITDDRINAYFLNSDLDVGNLGKCIVDQLGELAGCAGVVYSCGTMKAAHEGLGISKLDFTDFAEDFGVAWDQHKQDAPDLTSEDLDTVLGAFVSMAPDIIEDPTDNVTVYQRVGRKPGIRGLVGLPKDSPSFVDNVAKDASINGFFGTTDFDRLNTCLTRQLASLDGPSKYGKEVDPPADNIDPGVSVAAPCLDMITAHADLIDPGDQLGIEFADFIALVTDLVDALDNAGVQPDDQNIILGALGPLCSPIVTVDPENCP